MKYIKLNLLQKFTILIITISILSCSSDNDSLKTESNNNTDFITKLESNTFGNTKLISNNSSALRLNSNEKISITDNATEENLENINTVNELIASRVSYEIVEECPNTDCLTVITDNDAEQQALLQSAKQYLYDKGFNDTDLIEILDGEDEIILIALVAEMQAVYEIELRAINNGIHSGTPYLSFIDELNGMIDTNDSSKKLPQWAICAVEAIGLDIAYSFFSEGAEKFAKHSLKKAVKKIATKFLGPVGVGIAIAEFSWCMYVNS